MGLEMIKIIRPCISIFTSVICLIYINTLFTIMADMEERFSFLLIVGCVIAGASLVLNLIEVINLLGGTRE